MTTALSDLYDAILREPGEDLPRLIYADELDAVGECERAEFIRAQINGDESFWLGDASDDIREFEGLRTDWNDWRATEMWGGELNSIMPTDPREQSTVKWCRGFPAELTVPIGVFMGAECGRCSGRGEVDLSREPSSTATIDCPDCHGTGRTPGLASVICAKWPVSSITLSDKKPDTYSDAFTWWLRDGSNEMYRPHLPKEIFERISGKTHFRWTRAKDYPTREAALTALSHAAVAHARELAGLPPLKYAS